MLKKLSCSATKRSCFSTNHMGAQSSREEKEGKEKKEERTVKNGKSLARNIENEKAGGGEDENDVEDCITTVDLAIIEGTTDESHLCGACKCRVGFFFSYRTNRGSYHHSAT